MLVSPVMSFRHSADSGSANALHRSAPLLRRQFLEDAVGMGLKLLDPGVAHRARRHRRKHRLPLAICASPSLRIMLWPISTFISPFGWCEENTSMRFSCVKISSRRVNTVEPSCGTNAIGASLRIRASAG